MSHGPLLFTKPARIRPNMKWQSSVSALVLALGLLGPSMGGAATAGPPSQFGIDAPELARLGELAVGVRTLALVQRKQDDVLSFNPANGSFVKKDRALTVDLWYPATVPAGAAHEVYAASLPSEPPAGP